MKIKYFYLTFLLFFLSPHTASMAQIISLNLSNSREVVEGVRVAPRSSDLLIYVWDSTRRAIPGAHVMIVSGSDTINWRTNERGIVRYEKRFLTDSVELTIKHLGYETIKAVVEVPSAVQVRLAEKTYEIAEIKVEGDALAVIMKGDTVYFNATAFKTFEGDPMTALFEKLPGMEISENGLTYLGEKIHRLTIDGTRLFGDQVLLALENIRADDVVGVEVYKEASDWDKLNEVENPKLQNVANVKTKSKPSMIRNYTIKAAVGTYLDSDSQNDNEMRFSALGKLVSSRVGETLSAEVKHGDGSRFNTYKSIQTEGSFKYTRDEKDKFFISTFNEIYRNPSAGEQWYRIEYFPTENWLSRDYYSQSYYTNKKTDFLSINTFRYTFGDKSEISHSIKFSYTNDISKSTDIISATQDGVLTQDRNIVARDKNSSWSLNGSLSYRKAFESKIKLNVWASAAISENDGDGWRIDTLSTSTSQIYIENNSGGWSRKYSSGATLSIPFLPTLSMSVSDAISYIDSKSRRTSMDMLTGLMNVTNSYDYLIHELNNNLSTGISYNNNKIQKGISTANLDIVWIRKDMQRDERIPEEYEFPRTFNHLRIVASANYKLSAFNVLIFNYLRNENMTITLSDLREFLDDSNPALLRVGNPQLIIPVRSSMSVTGMFIKGASTYEFQVRYSATSNYIVDKHHYFSEDTYLPQFGYTASAGSSLITKENRTGDSHFHIEGKYSARSKKLKSNINIELSYGHNRTPAYINENPVMRIANRYSATLSISGNFSSVFSPSLRSWTSYSLSNSGNSAYKNIIQILNFDVRSRIVKRIDLNFKNTFRWDLLWPEVPNADRFQLISNLSLGYIFGKEKNFTVSLEGYDLFNRTQRISGGIDDESISTYYMRTVGRYIMFSVEWKF